MDTLATLQQQQQTAQASLDELRADLPRFHSLLTDNEQEAERLRRERAPLDEQAQAKNRVMVAREMLEQHQSDIQAAQGETTRLEGAINRERILLQLAAHSQTAKAERDRIDKAFLRLARELQRATGTIREAWTAENAARRAFADTGAELVPNLLDLTGSAYFTSDENEKARRRAFLKEISYRGGAPDAIRDGATGRFTYFDAYPVNGLPQDAVSVALWEAIRLLTEDDLAAHNLRRLTPARANPAARFGTVLEAGGVAHG